MRKNQFAILLILQIFVSSIFASDLAALDAKLGTNETDSAKSKKEMKHIKKATKIMHYQPGDKGYVDVEGLLEQNLLPAENIEHWEEKKKSKCKNK